MRICRIKSICHYGTEAKSLPWMQQSWVWSRQVRNLKFLFVAEIRRDCGAEPQSLVSSPKYICVASQTLMQCICCENIYNVIDINIKEKPGKVKWLKNMLKWRKECDTYLTTICRHHWSRQITMKVDKLPELSASADEIHSAGWKLQ
jgi:hypothetical protein